RTATAARSDADRGGRCLGRDRDPDCTLDRVQRAELLRDRYDLALPNRIPKRGGGVFPDGPPPDRCIGGLARSRLANSWCAHRSGVTDARVGDPRPEPWLGVRSRSWGGGADRSSPRPTSRARLACPGGL